MLTLVPNYGLFPGMEPPMYNNLSTGVGFIRRNHAKSRGI